jgi:hypothetical protein
VAYKPESSERYILSPDDGSNLVEVSSGEVELYLTPAFEKLQSSIKRR